MDSIDDITFLERFERGDFSPQEWTHRSHVKAAYLLLRRFPLDKAIEHMRSGLAALNTAHQVPAALDRGYHETMTQAWMRVIHSALTVHEPTDGADAFCDQHPHLTQSTLLRIFYSRDRIMSAEAKARFVPPDLTALPQARVGAFEAVESGRYSTLRAPVSSERRPVAG